MAIATCSAPDSKRRLDWLANRLWHTDASFRAVPGALSMLYAHVVPDEGGDTEFADLRAAYDALPQKTKDQIEPLIAEHSIWHSRGQLAVTRYTAGGARKPAAGAAARRAHAIPARAARRSMSRATPRTSWACRSPTAGCCCWT